LNSTVVRFNPSDPNLKAIRELAQQARSGKIVAFPTETVYGIGIPASHAKGLQKLYAIKSRDPQKPFAYHIGDWDQLAFLHIVRNPAFRYLSKKFWPGPVTLVVSSTDGEKIGLRYPRHLAASTLIISVGEPFLATSANRSGDPSPRTADEVLQALGSEVDYLIDAGPCELGQDSTVVDVTVNPPQILREGAEIEIVRQALADIELGRIPRKRILVVCTGNSCRSPMAAGLITEELRRRHLDLEIEVATCGILARDGGLATPEAVLLMKNREIDISGHRSRSCRKEDVMDADLILAMAQEHADFLTNLVPGIKERIEVYDVKDPIGQGIPVYEEVIRDLEKKIRAQWDEIVR